MATNYKIIGDRSDDEINGMDAHETTYERNDFDALCAALGIEHRNRNGFYAQLMNATKGVMKFSPVEKTLFTPDVLACEGKVEVLKNVWKEHARDYGQHFEIVVRING